MQAVVQHSTTSSRVGVALSILTLTILAFAPLFTGRAELRLLSEVFAYVALASLWNLLAGYAGLMSVGQQAYVGLGAYVTFWLSIVFGVPPFLAALLSAVAAAIVSLPVAWLIFRLRGHYFAIGTWVIAEVFRLVAAQTSSLGGGSGISLPVTVIQALAPTRTMRELLFYFLSLGVMTAVLLAIILLLRSRHGLALAAIRDNETAARTSGVDVNKLKLSIYIGVAFGTALVGALIFLQKLRISPETAFSVNDWAAFIIFIVTIGGIGRVEGPIIGTIVFFLLREFLADLGTTYLIVLGIMAIAVMIIAPQGLWGFVANRFGWQAFPLARHLTMRP